ncbi:unnamed protein product [marine sediment metagenome]|uniref:Uncharacterized protein n=1 Tax=marine sediment metagenome TaxID=412755 RepID=X0T6Q1_9ZZZZ
MKDNEGCFVFLLALGLGAILGFMIGSGLVGSQYQDRAIEAKVAHWAVDAETGETTFVYKTEEKTDE